MLVIIRITFKTTLGPTCCKSTWHDHDVGLTLP
jgi:hypothetical protein